MLEATPDGLDTGKPLALKGFLLTIKLSQEQRLTFGQRGYAELIKCPPVPNKNLWLPGTSGWDERPQTWLHRLGHLSIAPGPLPLQQEDPTGDSPDSEGRVREG